jgi:hypothetical protein
MYLGSRLKAVVDSMNSEEIYFVKALIVREVITRSNFRRPKVTFFSRPKEQSGGQK